MFDPHLQDQEKQVSLQDQQQFWKMRWFFIRFLAAFAFISILLTSIVILYIITTSISVNTVVVPLIPLLSSCVGLTSSFWLLAQRLTRYLFPMSERDLELAKEKLRYKGEKKMFGKIKDEQKKDQN